MNRKKGFTLVEITIVVAIIGILIAVAVPSFLRARKLSQRNACQSNMSQIVGAMDRLELENPGILPTNAPTTFDAVPLVGSENYLRVEPVCPGGGQYTFGLMVGASVVYCSYADANPVYAHELVADIPDMP